MLILKRSPRPAGGRVRVRRRRHDARGQLDLIVAAQTTADFHPIRPQFLQVPYVACRLLNTVAVFDPWCFWNERVGRLSANGSNAPWEPSLLFQSNRF